MILKSVTKRNLKKALLNRQDRPDQPQIMIVVEGGAVQFISSTFEDVSIVLVDRDWDDGVIVERLSVDLVRPTVEGVVNGFMDGET